MTLVDLDLRPDDRKLKQFGLIALVAFGLLGGLVLWKGGLFGFDFGGATTPVAVTLFALGGVSAVFSAVAPSMNRFLFIGLIVVTYPIGIVLSFTIMGVLYFVVITAVALWFRITGRDRLRLKPEPDAETYWIERKTRPDPKRYFKQF